ncbi:DUF2680 domain-containing protein [Dehalobacterium formicoaceticum]|uniref:YckD family protein n=1 Tax=Dehalobacterium formicoaceticum TaxID=51515 RepID=A0ABT1Y2K4_9FIRM|nr:DUF2680 domain-containing protein [Dehalobacterium formicoaceticum]MCR6545105.1 YckD family protein [Dehalobacterium formicoaceticum]
MKNLKKLVATVAIVGVLATAGVALAAELRSPAEIASDVTGMTLAQVNEERAAGKTYGQIAQDAGQLDQFKADMLEQKKALLDQRVAEGRLTQEQADEIYQNMEERQALCDGTGIGRKDGACGAGIGNCNGKGNGMGQGMMRQGMGRGMGQGMGAGWGNGASNGK